MFLYDERKPECLKETHQAQGTHANSTPPSRGKNQTLNPGGERLTDL